VRGDDDPDVIELPVVQKWEIILQVDKVECGVIGLDQELQFVLVLALVLSPVGDRTERRYLWYLELLESGQVLGQLGEMVEPDLDQVRSLADRFA
jgi:hypothetical protein